MEAGFDTRLATGLRGLGVVPRREATAPWPG